MKAALLLALGLCSGLAALAEPRLGSEQTPQDWRAEKRLIDLHQHLDYTPEHLARAIKIMDLAGIGVGVNLSGGTVTHKEGETSEFERNKKMADGLYPGRFVHYMNLDYADWDAPDFPERAAKQVEEGYRLGAAGLKEFKRLGLYLRDKNKQLIRVDDPKLDPVWEKCGELGLPISIHVADPKAFWEPYSPENERWTELKDHKSWWFGDPKVYPPRMEIVEALSRVVERHPKTTFVCVHFANNAEDLDWVERALDTHPNMMADIAARVPEIGRHAPDKVRRLFLKHQDRILFATDFQVYERLTLGSGGSGEGPSDDDARTFYEKHWRWFETNDRNFDHMTPIQGDWKISGIGLPASALRKIYFDNAHRLLARSLPLPRIVAARIPESLAASDLASSRWDSAPGFRVEYATRDGSALPGTATLLRVLYSPEYLYLRYDGVYLELTQFEPARLDSERIGLWDRDVVEAFIGTDPAHEKVYYEFEVAPTNEKLDLVISPDIPQIEKRLEWNSGWDSFVRVDPAKKVWTTVMRIPLKALSSQPVAPGTRWRANFYRIERAQRAFVAASPTLSSTFHAPARFGQLEFLP